MTVSARSLGSLLLLAATALAGESSTKLLKQLDGALKEENVDQVKSAVDALVALGDVKSAEAIFARARSEKLNVSPDLYEILLTGLASFTKDDVIAYYEKQLGQKEPAPRVLVIDVAARMTGEAGVSLILKGMKDDMTSVVEASLEAAQKRKPKAAIPILIDLVEDWSKRKVKDAVFYNIKETLIDITGENLDSAEDWRKWWNINKDSFDPTKVESGKTMRQRKLGGKDDPTFFGVQVSSKNAAFVIDTSLSMNLVHKDDIPGLTGVSGVDETKVVNQPKEKLTTENERLAKYWTRIEMAKRNLAKVLGALKAPARFNVVHFNDRAFPLNKKSQAVSSAGQKKAVGWVKSLQTRGYTNTLDAIKQVFESDPQLNTIYFLSDGVPSKDGKIEDDKKAILNEVLKLNRFRKIKIHTFGFHPFTMAGQPYPDLQRANEFLKELAQKTGGTFTAMKVDPNEKPPPDFH